MQKPRAGRGGFSCPAEKRQQIDGSRFPAARTVAPMRSLRRKARSRRANGDSGCAGTLRAAAEWYSKADVTRPAAQRKMNGSAYPCAGEGAAVRFFRVDARGQALAPPCPVMIFCST